MKNPRLDYIIHDLKECFDGKPWYGNSVMATLGTIEWENVNKKKYGKKSIAVLLRHIINWRIFVLKKLQDDVEYDLKIDDPNDWTYIHINNQQEWIQLKSELQKTQEELLSILSNANESIISKTVPGKKYSFGNVLPSILQHDLYHTGQIAMLNNMIKG